MIEEWYGSMKHYLLSIQQPDGGLFRAVRAELLRRLGRTTEAALAYEAAAARTVNAAECRFLERRRQLVRDGCESSRP